MTEPQHQRFQAKFPRYLPKPATCNICSPPSLTTGSPTQYPGDSFPQATVWRLLAAVSPLYHGAVAALVDPETTLAALVLMRGLIEAWAQLYFLMGNDEGADAACRAIRLEIGWASSTVGLSQTPEMTAQLPIATKRLNELDAMRSQRGCKGGRRNYGDVDQTVTTMARRHGIDWLPGAWRSASQMTHVSGWDWTLEDQGDGTSALVHPAPSHRASRLNHLVVLFYNVTQTALVVLGVDLDSDEARSVHTLAMRILDHRFLRRAIEGDYD